MSRFVLSNVQSGPADLRAALPLAGDTIGIRTGPDGTDLYYAVLDEPVRYRAAHFEQFAPQRRGEDASGPFVWVSDLVIRPAVPGQTPHYGMAAFPVEIAYVLDSAVRNVETLRSGDFEIVGEGSIDDADDPPPRPLIELPPLADELQPEQHPLMARQRRQGAGPVENVAVGERVHPQREQAAAAVSPEGDLDIWNPDSEPAATAVATDIASGQSATQGSVRLSTQPVRPAPDTPERVVDLATESGSIPQVRNRIALWAALAAAALVALVGVVAYTVSDHGAGNVAPDATLPTLGSKATPEPTTPPAPPLVAPVGDPASVLGLLPAGYPPGACSPDPEVPLGALAALSCSANTDPGGPVHGHYTVVADRKNLQEQFDRLVQTSRQQVCPGRIQSPGPWRHNATPDQVAGTLYCGVRPDNSPFIAWTDDAKMLLAVVDSTPGDEATTFKWWSAHS